MAESHIANQFRGLPMYELISGPMSAVCEAQTELAKATAGFIADVGLEKDTGKVKMVDFTFRRPKETASQDGTGVNFGEEEVALTVPFLSLVNTPSLSVKKVEITFDMEVKETTSDSSSLDTSVGLDAKGGFNLGFVSATVNIKGSVSTHKENTRKTDNSAKYHVYVQATDGGMTEGMSRVYDILQSAIAPRKIVSASDGTSQVGQSSGLQQESVPAEPVEAS